MAFKLSWKIPRRHSKVSVYSIADVYGEVISTIYGLTAMENDCICDFHKWRLPCYPTAAWPCRQPETTEHSLIRCPKYEFQCSFFVAKCPEWNVNFCPKILLTDETIIPFTIESVLSCSRHLLIVRRNCFYFSHCCMSGIKASHTDQIDLYLPWLALPDPEYVCYACMLRVCYLDDRM